MLAAISAGLAARREEQDRKLHPQPAEELALIISPKLAPAIETSVSTGGHRMVAAVIVGRAIRERAVKEVSDLPVTTFSSENGSGNRKAPRESASQCL